MMRFMIDFLSIAEWVKLFTRELMLPVGNRGRKLKVLFNATHLSSLAKNHARGGGG
jgi:hypothetical protein